METLWPATNQVAGNQRRRARGLWPRQVRESSTGRHPDQVRALMTSSNCFFVFVFVCVCNPCSLPAAGRSKAGSFSLLPLNNALAACNQNLQSSAEFSCLPPGGAPDELLSSSSIFDHVDRLSRGSSDGTRRPANKVQLIAMQPRPSPAHPSPAHPSPQQPSPTLSERVNTEVGGILFLFFFICHVTWQCVKKGNIK